MGKLFGTDGIRGVANKELTAKLAFDVGRSGAYVLTKEKKHAPRIIIGMDTRISGDMLESALVAGMCSYGAKVYCAGVVPTPAIAYLTRKYGLDAGIVISASHNPFGDNGIKFFNSEGYKLRDELEEEIEDIIFNSIDDLPWPTGDGIGHKIDCPDALEDYIKFLEESMDNFKLDGLTIALDCANGATYQSAPSVFTDLGAHVFAIHADPNGVNINNNCGSTHTNSLIKFVKENNIDIGIAYDGDGDRLMIIDEKGNLIEGDEILSILGVNFKNENKLSKDTIVATVMSNLGLGIMGEKNGIAIKKSAVGDRYVLEKMLKNGYNLGGEQSGHIIMLDYNTTGDGILASLHLARILKQSGKKMSELNCYMEVLPQILVNASVKNENKYKYLENETIRLEIEELEGSFAGNGRVLIRPSGTEPLVRVMLEGLDKEFLETEAKRIANLIEEILG